MKVAKWTNKFKWFSVILIVFVITGIWLTTDLPIDKNSINREQIDSNFSQIDSQPIHSSPNILSSLNRRNKFQNVSSLVQKSAQKGNQKVNPKAVNQVKDQILDKFGKMQQRLVNNPNSGINGLSRARGQHVLNPEQQKSIDQLLETLGDDAVLHMDNLSGTLRYLEGDLKKIIQNSDIYHEARSRNNFGDMSVALLGEINTVLNIEEPAKEFFAEKVKHDELGMTHVILQQQFNGVPIWGAEIGLHYNDKGDPIQISGVYASTPTHLRTVDQKIDKQQAIAKAKEAIGQPGTHRLPPKIQRMIYWDLDRAPVLCYNVDMTPNAIEAWEVFISVADGSVVHKYDEIVYDSVETTAPDLVGTPQTFNCWQDQGNYFAIDTTLPMYDPASSQPPDINKLKGALFILDFRNQDPRDQNTQVFGVATHNINNWDPHAVTLMSYYPQIYSYYRNTFDRNSIDNEGLNIEAWIHFRWPSGANQTHSENACWNPNMKAMFFGDGEQLAGGKLPYAMDVVAHEYTHGITGFEAGLIYENQSGALDEGFSDFFGCMVDREDWLLAEDIVPFGVNADKIAMRDMSNPGNPQVTDQNPATMSEYRYLPIDQDHGGVHINCGIPSYLMYLLAKGGDYAISKEKTEQIVYRARNNYLTQRSQFIDFRRALTSAARDLYGENSQELESVKKACDAVGILEGDTSPPPSTPGQVVSGDEQFVFLLADPSVGYDQFRNDYFYKLVLNAQGENYLIASRYVAGSRPAVSGDGEWGLYVDLQNNIYWTNGAEEEQWTTNSIVRTIAMSKNQRYIAFTTIDYNNMIHIINTQTKEVADVELKVPLNSEYASTIDLHYADVMTFNFRGDHLIFDGVSERQLATGEKYASWGIYSLRLSDLSCSIVMPQKPDEQIGDPIFAHTNDSLLLADMIKTQQNQSVANIISLDFSQNKIGLLMDNTGILARPSFRGDDQKVVFLSVDTNQQLYLLIEGQLTNDNLGFVENSFNVVLNSDTPIAYPVAFRAGEYQSQEGKISVPDSISFGEVQAGQPVEKTLTISNSGNADLRVLSITIEGENASWFSHNGLEQLIPPGENYNVQLTCNPQLAGPFSASLHVKSTDIDKADVSISLEGTAEGTIPPTNTPIQPTTPTAAPVTNTPVIPIPPTDTPFVEDVTEPVVVYEFDQMDLTTNGWKEIPGGFTGAPKGQISSSAFVGQIIPSSQDQIGISITVQSGQIAFIHALNPVNTGGKPVLLRMTARSTAPEAAIATALLKGNLSNYEFVDNSIATHIPKNAAAFVTQERQHVLIYEPDSAQIVTPIIQVAATGQSEAVTVFVDKLEIFVLDSNHSYPGNLFSSLLDGSDNSPATVVSSPDVIYEFDQLDLTSNGWKEIGGGFTGAPAGQVINSAFVGNLIPSSQDNVGINITVEPNEVAFIHPLEPVNSEGHPVLVRMTVRADAPKAAISSAALKGNLTTNEDVDGSIATLQPSTAASSVEKEYQYCLVYEPDSSNWVSPVIQVAAIGQSGSVITFVDRVEVFILRPDVSYPGYLFSSNPSQVPEPSLPTPTPIIQDTQSPIAPTSTPTYTYTPTPTATTGTPSIISEQESNDSQAQAQTIGTLNQESTIQLSGNMSKGGFVENAQGELQYLGDPDNYSFTVGSQTNITLTLNWTEQADLDLYLFSEGQLIDKDETTNIPAGISRTLAPGNYNLLILSFDNPADYTLTIFTEGG